MSKEILNLKINYDSVIMRMGANKHKTKIEDNIKNSIIESIEFAKKLLKPKYAVSFADKRSAENKIFLDGFIIESTDILKLLEKSYSVCGIAATIGSSLDDKIDLLLEEKKLALSYIYDAIGSVAIEELVDNICNDVKLNKSKENISYTRRFSPGYGDWPIENQKDFLKWLGADKIGISLSESCQMFPRKSVSAIFGMER
ncbi:MAG: hypothetical protein VB017_01700 [Endomicrobiaceae bacterium]|jgi:hypothetical protein|nr:hypothetical protein [Endomicrobiaceae bacterium]